MARRKKLRFTSEQRKRKRNRRIIAFGVVSTAMMLALLFVIGHINVTFGAQFERYAVSQLIIRQESLNRVIPPVHGSILDRNRQPIIDSERVYNIRLDVRVLASLQSHPTRNPTPQQDILEVIHEVLEIPMETLWGFLATDSDGELIHDTNWLLIDSDVPAHLALSLTHYHNLRHVHLEERALRRFPDPYLAPQTLGFVRGDASWGLELRYREEMAGEPGRVFRAFQSDSVVLTEETPVRDGHMLVTTLDSGIQRIAQRHVEQAAHYFGAEYTGIIIMNPQTGEVLSMAQWPSFSLESPDDGTLFTDPQASNFWHYMNPEEQLNHMMRVWNNFFLTRSFEPGSTFKPFVMAAALEEGLISPNNHFYCRGYRDIADRTVYCHNRHGNIDLLEALRVSCNIAMIDINNAMGRDLFYSYRNDFGFGQRTGIDLPGEEAVSSPLVMYTLDRLNSVEMATSSIGQGFNATPLQSINAFSALINGGYIMRPFVVSQIVDAHGNIVHENRPTAVRNVLSQQTSDFIRIAMQEVMSPAGTGRRAAIDGYAIGGKTGTAQQGAERDWIVTSFLGYMPVENPQFLAMAIVYNPANTQISAGNSSAIMVRDVFEEIIQYKQLPPTGEEQATGTLVTAGAELMQDFSGMYLKDVTPILINMGIDFDVVGRGSVVVMHIPAAGYPIPRNVPLWLHLDNDVSDMDSLTFMPSVEGLPIHRAEEVLLANGLYPIISYSSAMGQGDWAFDAINDESTTQNESEIWQIYRQSPSSGVHIQRGTQVRLRARPRD